MAEKPNESVNGWTPPLVYADYEDKWRVATQEDIDQLLAVRSAYWKLTAALKDAGGILSVNREELQNAIFAIGQKYKRPG